MQGNYFINKTTEDLVYENALSGVKKTISPVDFYLRLRKVIANMTLNGIRPYTVKEKQHLKKEVASAIKNMKLDDVDFNEILDQMYTLKRYAPYQSNLHYKEIGNNQHVVNGTVSVCGEKGSWIYRAPKEYIKNQVNQLPTVWRFAVNADINPASIAAMDSFCEDYGLIYKMPDRSVRRTDTMVVYVHTKNLNDQMIQDLVQRMSPFVRTDLPERTNDLDGYNVAKGIIVAPEISKQNISTYLEEIRQTQPVELYQVIDRHVKEQGGVSLGMQMSHNKLINAYNICVGTNGALRPAIYHMPLSQESQDNLPTLKAADPVVQSHVETQPVDASEMSSANVPYTMSTQTQNYPDAVFTVDVKTNTIPSKSASKGREYFTFTPTNGAQKQNDGTITVDMTRPVLTEELPVAPAPKVMPSYKRRVIIDVKTGHQTILSQRYRAQNYRTR